jgi:hypothetical protein
MYKYSNNNIREVKFRSTFEAKSEVDKYCFIKSFYPNVPDMFYDNGKTIVGYRRIGKPTTAELLNRNEVCDLKKLFNHMCNIFNKYSKICIPDGGTKLFYVDRIERLKNIAVISEYRSFAEHQKIITINGKQIMLIPDLFEKIIRGLKFNADICVPSQGDFHERNIFLDGTIIDFEGSGWNLVYTDVSTFIWHVFFAGNYFGNLYAKWANLFTKFGIRFNSTISVRRGFCLQVKLNYARKKLMNEYLYCYLYKINYLNQKSCKKVSLSVAFRLLSAFNLHLMTKKDRLSSYALASFFADENLTLNDKISTILS